MPGEVLLDVVPVFIGQGLVVGEGKASATLIVKVGVTFIVSSLVIMIPFRHVALCFWAK